tara:strand:- start:2133 stop:2795 length:663 start_codon:yes stop_codon:yes gene_type:complete
MLVKATDGNMWSRIRFLQRHGFDPKRIIDVGAYDGLWASRAAALFSNADVLMIEPQLSMQDKLESVCRDFPGRLKFQIGLLGRESGKEVQFFQMETGSSFFEDLSDYPRTIVKMKTTTLDDIVSSHGIRQVDLLKIDVQGAELEVLVGGSNTLDLAHVVLLELSVSDCNAGAPNAAQIIGFMYGKGFIMRDMADVRRLKKGQPVHQFDAFFVRASSPLYD